MSTTIRIATTADWRPGKKIIIPFSVKDDEAKALFPRGWTVRRPQ